MSSTARKSNRKSNTALWTIQALLAALFLFAGVMKFVIPAQMLTSQSHLPLGFMLFIGAAEVTGAFGLVLPGLTHIGEVLTPLAASGLVIIMIGATIITALEVSVLQAVTPLIVGVLAFTVARARWPARAQVQASV